MAEFVRSLTGLLVRLALLLAGVLFFVSVLAAGMVVLMLWLLRALWAKVTGQPVRPWVFQMNRRPPWQQADRGAGPEGAQRPMSDDVIDAEVKEVPDVTDVQVKPMDPSR